jgi:hypothetical protein
MKSSRQGSSWNLFIAATLFLVVGVVTWYIGESNAIKNMPSYLSDTSFSLWGQVVIFLANPLLVLSSISFVVKKKTEMRKAIRRFFAVLSLGILIPTGSFWVLYSTRYPEFFTTALSIIAGSIVILVVVYYS